MRKVGNSKIPFRHPRSLRASTQTYLKQGGISEMSPGLFQDFMEGYIKP